MQTNHLIANWWQDFGDNDLIGWATTAAYFFVAALCVRAARAIRRSGAAGSVGPPAPAGQPGHRPRDWHLLALGVFLLGLNKQLDLQILARDVGLALVKAAGFNAQRKWVGRLMFLALAAAILWVLARAARHLRRARRGHTLTLLGIAMLATFLIVRAAGYQPYLRDLNLRFKDVLHLVLELGGLVLLGVSAWRASTRRPPPELEHE